MLLSETAMASRRFQFRRSAHGVLGGLLALVVSASACSSANPISPSPAGSSLVAAHEPAPIPAPANNVMLTVRVLARTSETPIEGATVTVVDRSYKTDPAGTCTFPVETGHMTDVDVTASGYLPIGAGGVLSSDERWTFYLAQP